MARIIESNFTKLIDGLNGAEGPVFSANGDFYAVAPGESIDDNKFWLCLYLHELPVMARILEPIFSKIVEGINRSEGPVFSANGDFFAVAPGEKSVDNSPDETRVFQDKTAGKLYKINVQTGEKSVACIPWVENFGGRPAGCQSDKDGNIWIADMRLGILKYTPGGDCTQISKVDSDGNPMNGCNDLVFDNKGNLYITGPGSPIAPVPEDRNSIFQELSGRLYYLGKGSSIPRRIPNEAFRFCNGIAIKDDVLYVAETMTRSILAFDVMSPGNLKNRRTWARLPEAKYSDPLNVGGPDGMDFDSRGCLLAAHYGGGHIEVFSLEGVLEARIKTPFDKPSNLHFRKNSSTCYVTEHSFHAVWKFDWECHGEKMYCDI